jgi:hypothetical protein
MGTDQHTMPYDARAAPSGRVLVRGRTVRRAARAAQLRRGAARAGQAQRGCAAGLTTRRAKPAFAAVTCAAPEAAGGGGGGGAPARAARVMFGDANSSSAGAAAAAAAAARDASLRQPLRVHPAQSAASLLRHVSWGTTATSGGDAAMPLEPAASEGRPLLAGTLRAARSGSFARLKSLSRGGAGYDATADGGGGGTDYPDRDDASGRSSGDGTTPGGGFSGAPEGRRGAWHRCNASVGAPPAFVAHFALGAGTFIQGCGQRAHARARLRGALTPRSRLHPRKQP